MNKIDFSHPGGFPLTQDELDFMQQSYISCIEALGSAGVSGSAPTVLTGMAVSGTMLGGTAVSSGWFMYGGELIQFIGSSGIGTVGTVPLVLITDNTTNLTYNDTSTFPAHHSKTATLTFAPSITDATHFPVSALVPWLATSPFTSTGIVFGSSSFGYFTSANLGAPYFDVAYRKYGNEVSLCGAISASVTIGGTYPLITLPVAPANRVTINPLLIGFAHVAAPIYIDTGGNLQFSDGVPFGSDTGIVYLDGVSFRLD